MNSEKIDKILLNKFYGIPLFLVIMWVVFQTVFTLGAIPMNSIDKGVSLLQEFLTWKLPESIWSSMLIDGIIGGIGAMQNDPSFSPFIAVLILIFMLLYSPCIPVIATIKHSFGTRWAIFSFLYPTALA